MKPFRVFLAFVVGTLALLPISASADGDVPEQFGPWQAAVSIDVWPGADPTVNTPALEGCPSLSPDGLSLYFASNRVGGFGGLDLYVSQRAKKHDPWGPAVNLGPTINTAGDEFCPTPLRDRHTLLFVSTRQDLATHCGGSDIYRSTLDDGGIWSTPVNLGCSINSSADEASPSLVGGGDSRDLYFSSTRSGSSHVYFAHQLGDSDFGPVSLVPGVNSAASDSRPNVRHDGLEMCFDSNRPGGLGLSDIYLTSRATPSDPWGTPVNAGANVNSGAVDARCSLSWDATTMYFGSTRPGGRGSSDLYVTTRAEVGG